MTQKLFIVYGKKKLPTDRQTNTTFIFIFFKAGKKILIAAHGNSLRGIVKHLDSMSDEAIMGCNLPTGIPFVYELDADLKVKLVQKFQDLFYYFLFSLSCPCSSLETKKQSRRQLSLWPIRAKQSR